MKLDKLVKKEHERLKKAALEEHNDRVRSLEKAFTSNANKLILERPSDFNHNLTVINHLKNAYDKAVIDQHKSIEKTMKQLREFKRICMVNYRDRVYREATRELVKSTLTDVNTPGRTTNMVKPRREKYSDKRSCGVHLLLQLFD